MPIDIILAVFAIIVSTLTLYLQFEVTKDQEELDRICANLDKLKNTQR